MTHEQVAAILAARDSSDVPEAILGWHLDGPGPARHGWAWRHPTGRVEYLHAETWATVRDRAEWWREARALRAAIAAAVAEGA